MSLAFILGLVGGYLVPLTFRLGPMIGRERIERTPWLRVVGMFLFFLGLLSPLIVAAALPYGYAKVFPLSAAGMLAMAALGTALQPDVRERVAA
jgi:hypothetical protein